MDCKTEKHTEQKTDGQNGKTNRKIFFATIYSASAYPKFRQRIKEKIIRKAVLPLLFKPTRYTKYVKIILFFTYFLYETFEMRRTGCFIYEYMTSVW